MRIAFDYQIFHWQKYGGISRYFVQLTKELLKCGQEVHIFAPLHKNIFLYQLPKTLFSGSYLKSYPDFLSPIILSYNRFAAQKGITRWNPDVIHETYYAAQNTRLTKPVNILTVYDMIHESVPNEFPFSEKVTAEKQQAVERADHVICISNQTRNDLIEKFKIEPEKTTVVHLGVDPVPQLTPDNWRDHTDKPFLLFVGNRAGYKNFSGFLKAFSRSTLLRTDFDVVAFGGGEFLSSEKTLIDKLGLSPARVRQIGGSDDVLNNLYLYASALVFPSFYEGFGLPMLEAMSRRCPVICSNISVMSEVSGLAAEYFDPANIEDIKQSIEQVVYSNEQLTKLTQYGLDRIKQFSWSKCAKETLTIYQKVYGSTN